MERTPLNHSLFDPPTGPYDAEAAEQPPALAAEVPKQLRKRLFFQIVSDLFAGTILFMFGCVFSISAAHAYLPPGAWGVGMMQCCIGMSVGGFVYQAVGTRVPYAGLLPDLFVALFFAGISKRVDPGALWIYGVASQVFLGLSLTVVSKFKMLSIADWIPSPVACGLLAGIGVCIARMGADIATSGGSWMLSLIVTLLLRLREETTWQVAIFIGCFIYIYFDPSQILRIEMPPVVDVVPIVVEDVRRADLTALRETTADLFSMTILILLKENLMYSTMDRVFVEELEDDYEPLREIRSMGIAATILSACGGIYSPPSIGPMMIVKGFQPSHKGPAFILVALSFIAVWRGLLFDFPNFLCAGLLFLSGVKLVESQLLAKYSKLPGSEFSIIAAIAVSMPLLGLLQGLGLGLCASLLLFASEYLAVGGIKFVCDGTAARSAAERNREDELKLRENAHLRQYLQLQGYLFFGNAAPVTTFARLFVFSKKGASLVVDFAFVAKLDASAVDVFDRLAQDAAKNECPLKFCGVSDSVIQQLKLGCAEDFFDLVVVFPDAEKAIYAVENEQLAQSASSSVKEEEVEDDSLKACLKAVGGDTGNLAEKLVDYLSTVRLAPGKHVEGVRQIGESALHPSLYFVATGRVVLERDPWQSVATMAGLTVKNRIRPDIQQNATKFRIAEYGPGAVIGLEAFVLGYYSIARYVVNEQCTLYKLSQTEFERLKETDPNAALALMELCATRLARHSEHTYEQLAILRDAFLGGSTDIENLAASSTFGSFSTLSDDVANAAANAA